MHGQQPPAGGGVVTAGDDAVLDLIATGAPLGVEMLYDRFGRLAYSLAYRVLRDGAAAEDVVQEAFLSVWRRSATYQPGRGTVRTWICSIVHHRALDRLRGRSGRDRQLLPLEGVPPETSISDTWDEVAAEIERDHIRRALVELPQEQRRTIELAYFDGYSQSEIGELMGVPLGTVKGRTRMALRKLRAALERQGMAEPVT